MVDGPSPPGRRRLIGYRRARFSFVGCPVMLLAAAGSKVDIVIGIVGILVVMRVLSFLD